MATVSRSTLNTDGLAMLATADAALRTKLDAMLGSGKEITQSDLLAAQYQIQSVGVISNLMASSQKELADMLKSVISKF